MQPEHAASAAAAAHTHQALAGRCRQSKPHSNLTHWHPSAPKRLPPTRNRHQRPFSWLHSWGHSSTRQGTHRLAEGLCILLLQNPVEHTEAALQGVPLPQAAAPFAGLLRRAGQIGRSSDMSTATAEAVQAVAWQAAAGLLCTASQMGRSPDVPSHSVRSCAGGCWLHAAVPGHMAQDLTRCAKSEGMQAVCSGWATTHICARSHICARLSGHAALTCMAKGCAGTTAVPKTAGLNCARCMQQDTQLHWAAVVPASVCS